jgi:Fe-S-cluster containining protein
MNFPAIAKNTYDRLKSNEEFAFITDLIIFELKDIKNAITRARLFHNKVDKYAEEVFAHPLVKEFSPCKRGCSGCCHTEVSVTNDESELLASRVKNGLKINLERLHLQKQTAKAGKNFYTLPYESRACVFLGEKGTCEVYTDRPAVCRTNAVLGSSEQCSTENGAKTLMRLVKTDAADMAIMGAFLVSPKSGSLGEMLWDKLDAIKKVTLNPMTNYKAYRDFDA